MSVSWAGLIQSIYPFLTSCKSVLILSIHQRLGLPSGLFPSGFPTDKIYTHSPDPYAPHALPISFFFNLSPAQYWVSITDHLAPPYTISSITPLPHPSLFQTFPSKPWPQTPLASFLPQYLRPSFTTRQNKWQNYRNIYTW